MTGCRLPGRGARRGQREIQPFGFQSLIERARGERLLPRVEGGFERLLGGVERFADRAALRRAQLAHR